MSSDGRFAAVVFDLDGVLVDSEPAHHRASRRLVDPRDITDEEYASFVGADTESFMRWLIARDGLSHSVEELTDRYTSLVTEEVRAQPLPLLPGARVWVDAVRSRGLPIGLCSQSLRPWVDATLEVSGLTGCFDATVTGEEAQPKPAPDLYLCAAERLGVDPTRCLAIEDSAPGVRAAAAAGMTVLQTRGGSGAPPPQAAAHLVVESLAALEVAWLDALR